MRLMYVQVIQAQITLFVSNRVFFLILNLFDVSEGGCPEYDHHNSGCALKKLHWLFGPEHPI